VGMVVSVLRTQATTMHMATRMMSISRWPRTKDSEDVVDMVLAIWRLPMAAAVALEVVLVTADGFVFRPPDLPLESL